MNIKTLILYILAIATIISIGCGTDVDTDTTTYIWAEFGTPTISTNDGTLKLNLSFYANSQLTQKQTIIGFDKQNCQITHIEGDDISDMPISITGSGAHYTINFKPQIEREGEFSVNISGDFFSTNITGETIAADKIATEDIIVTPITIKYNTVLPSVENAVISTDKENDRLDVLIQFNIPVIDLSWGDIETTGYDADIGLGSVFRATTKSGDVFTKPTTNPPSKEWIRETTDTTTPGMYFLIRYNAPKEGVVHFFLRDGAVYNAFPIIHGYPLVRAGF